MDISLKDRLVSACDVPSVSDGCTLSEAEGLVGLMGGPFGSGLRRNQILSLIGSSY